MSDLISRKAAIYAFTWHNGERIPEHDCDNFPVEVPIKTVKKILNELPSAQQWIPCSERLPKVRTDVILQFKDNMCVGFLSHGDWNINSGGGYYTGVTKSEEQPVAWMPLPEKYKEVEHD